MLNLYSTNHAQKGLRSINAGDCASPPARYFPQLHAALGEVRMTFWPAVYEQDIIIGGGGLLNHEFFMHHISRHLAAAQRRIIVWGAGTNYHHITALEYPPEITSFDLCGTRDWGSDQEWVPCASCMLPFFDDVPEPTHDVVVYKHWQQEMTVDQRYLDHGLPQCENNRPLDEALSFIASGATVLTNTYHGAYWATLMGRKVVVINPFSSRFHHMRWPPVITDMFAWSEAAPQQYPEALEQSREANLAFLEKVLDD